MKTIPIKEFQALIKAQGVPQENYALVCPMCGTVQSPGDLIRAGAGKTLQEVETYFGFSCVGRWTHQLPPPSKKKKGKQVGCNWTLGGLFRTHTLEVLTPDGKTHPVFEPATPEEAQKHQTETNHASETNEA